MGYSIYINGDLITCKSLPAMTSLNSTAADIKPVQNGLTNSKYNPAMTKYLYTKLILFIKKFMKTFPKRHAKL